MIKTFFCGPWHIVLKHLMSLAQHITKCQSLVKLASMLLFCILSVIDGFAIYIYDDKCWLLLDRVYKADKFHAHSIFLITNEMPINNLMFHIFGCWGPDHE